MDLCEEEEKLGFGRENLLDQARIEICVEIVLRVGRERNTLPREVGKR